MPIAHAVRALRVILVLGTILHLTGGHWGVLQGIAWTKMIVDYSATDGFLVGTQKTFSGKHPCAMCKSIAKSRKSENRQELPASARRDLTVKEILLPSQIVLRQPKADELTILQIPQPRLESSIWSASPPSPPPRA